MQPRTANVSRTAWAFSGGHLGTVASFSLAVSPSIRGIRGGLGSASLLWLSGSGQSARSSESWPGFTGAFGSNQWLVNPSISVGYLDGMIKLDSTYGHSSHVRTRRGSSVIVFTALNPGLQGYIPPMGSAELSGNDTIPKDAVPRPDSNPHAQWTG